VQPPAAENILDEMAPQAESSIAPVPNVMSEDPEMNEIAEDLGQSQ